MSKTKTIQAHSQARLAVLRGGRMTKFKGQVASFAPTLGMVLSGASALALGFGGTAATAGSCTDQGSGAFLCSGPADPVNDVEQVLGDGNGPITVTTAPGFGLNTGTQSGITLYGEGVSFTDTNASQITADGNHGISARTVFLSDGDLSISSNGNITGGSFGISAQIAGVGALTIDAANVTGTRREGIRAINFGQELTINVSEAVTGDQHGIFAFNYNAGALSITTRDATGTRYSGITAFNEGTDLSVTSSGTVTGGEQGIAASNVGSGALTIRANNVTGGSQQAIQANNGASGTDLSITTTGAVRGSSLGIQAMNNGSGALTISANEVYGQSQQAIEATNAASGTDLTITTTGRIAGADGILATNNGSGALTINTSDQVGGSAIGYAGINATNNGTDLTITTSLGVGGGQFGVRAQNNGSGALSLNTGSVTGQTGIEVTNSGTNLSVNANSVYAGDTGITATNNGSGALTITAGDIRTFGQQGIVATNGSTGTDLSITTTRAVDARGTAIEARNSGTGAVTINTTDVASDTGQGIFARNSSAGTDVSVTSTGTINSLLEGVNATNDGSGDLTINANNVTSIQTQGIYSSNSGGALTITTTGTVNGNLQGVFGRNLGTGALTVNTASVTSATDAGIQLFNYNNATDLSVTASGPVTGSRTGIDVVNYGSGNLTVAAADVSGTNAEGISAYNENGNDLSIRSTGAVIGNTIGIDADNGFSTGALTISAHDVTGNTRQGILAQNGTSGTDLSITTTGTVTSRGGGTDGISIAATNLGSGSTSITTADVGDNSLFGIVANSGTNTTGLNITANGNISALNEAIRANHQGSGDLTITANSIGNTAPEDVYTAITATTRAASDNLTVTTTGDINSYDAGIVAQHNGSGALTISTVSVLAEVTEAIRATSAASSTDLTITSSGQLQGGRGVFASNGGTGATTVTVTDVFGLNTTGIDVSNTSAATGDLSITATNVQAANIGILTNNRGSGALTITAADVTGTSDQGISATNGASGTDLSITSTGTVTGRQRGIQANNQGSGDLTITANAVNAANGQAIAAFNSGRDLTVNTTGVIFGGRQGIRATNQGSGALTINAADQVNSFALGIFADNQGSGAVTINATDVNGGYGQGIEVSNMGDGVSITTTGSVTSTTEAISASNQGTGTLSITARDVTSHNRRAIVAQNASTASDLQITTTGDVAGRETGIFAANGGSGTLTINSGNVSGTNDTGIRALNNGTDLSVTSTGTASGLSYGIAAVNLGSGALNITAQNVRGGSGNGGEGIQARNSGTDLNVTATGDVSGDRIGISATNFGSGSVAVDASGSVTSNIIGIRAENQGSGDVTVNANNVTGTSRGVLVVSQGRDVNVNTSGTVRGGSEAILVNHLGAGTVNITTSGQVEGGSRAAIDARTLAGNLSVIDLQNGTSVLTGSGRAIENNEGDSRVILRSGSSLAGSVNLNGGQDALIIEGGADISAATLFDGGDGAADEVTFSGFTGAFDSARFANWETLTADNGSALTVDSANVTGLNTIRATNNATITAQDAAFSFAGALDVGQSARFLAGANGQGTVSVTGSVINNGLISLADGQSGDRVSFGSDLSGSGTIGLDVNLSTGENDTVSVGGNSAGARQGLQITKSGSGNGTQSFTLVTVSGNSTAGDFRLVNADFVTNDGQQAITDGEFVYTLQYDAAAGAFALNPFLGADGNPTGDFVAAGVQQFSDHLTFGGTLQRVMASTGRGSAQANTVSRALNELTSTTRPLVWVLAEGARDRYAVEGRDVETTSGGLRFGAGLPVAELAGGQLIGGLEFGVGSLSTTVTNATTRGDIDTDAYDVTLSALWLANSQLYVDGQLRYAYFDSTTRPNGGSSVDSDGDGYGVSIEVGKPFALQNGLSLIPQAQLSYSDIDIDEVVNLAGGSDVGSLIDGDTLTARLGLRAEQAFGNGSVLFGQVDYIHAFDDETAVTFGQNAIITERGRNSAALTLGGQINLSERATLFGEIRGETGLGGNSDEQSYGGQIGLEWRF